MYCRNCGKEISDKSRYCRFCGSPQNTVNGKIKNKPSKNTAAVQIAAVLAAMVLTALCVFLLLYFIRRPETKSKLSQETLPQEAKDEPWREALTEDFLLPAQYGELWGYKNLDGEWVIEPVYDGVNFFTNNGTSIVVKDGEALIIDKSGALKNKVDFKQEITGAGNKTNFYLQNDFVNGKIMISWSSDGWDEEYAFMDEEGKITYFPDNLRLGSDEATQIMVDKGWYCVYDEYQDKYGYIDGNMNWIIPAIYDDIKPMSVNGMIPVKTEDGWGYLNENGEMVIPPELLSVDSGSAIALYNAKYNEAGLFGSNGLAPVRRGEKWGFINEQGEDVIEFRYDEARGFGGSDIAAVRIDDKWGCIDAKGREVIPLEYDTVRHFMENDIYACNLVEVSKDGAWGCVDSSGREIIPLEYTNNCLPISDTTIVAAKDGEVFVLNNKNQVLHHEEYDGGDYIAANYGLFELSSNGDLLWLDFDGNIY